jgi:pseudouridine kinase
MGIVVIGAVFVDIKGYPLSTYIPGGRNAGRVEQVHGGVCRNVAEDIANVELRPTFVSLVDETGSGQDVIDKLARHKVNTRYIRRVPDGMGTWLAVFDNDGDVCAAISKRPDTTPLTRLLQEQGDEIFADCDGIAIELDLEKETVKQVLHFAKKYRKKVYAAVSNMSIAMERRDFLQQIDCFVCNQQEAGILFSENYDNFTPDEMLPVLHDKIRGAQIRRMVVTMGAQGAVFATLDGEEGYCPAKKVDVKDTTGAGDAFFAGTVIGQTYGKTMMESCEIGTRLAASVITTGENVCPRYLPSEFGLDVSALDDAQLALEL